MKRHLVLWFMLALVTLMIAMNTSANGSPNVVYVDDDWAGLPDGTTVSGHTIGYDAFASIQDAVNAVASGGTVYVWNGTYTENIVVDKTVTIIGNGTENCTVEANDINNHVFSITADWVNISGLTIKNATGDSKAGIYIEGADHCNISGNNITSNYYGIWISDASDYNDVYNNEIISNNGPGVNIGGGSSHNSIVMNNISENLGGIYTNTNYNFIAYNTLLSNYPGHGISIYSWGSFNTIRNNTIRYNNNGVEMLSSSSYNEVVWNNITNNYDSGVILSNTNNNSIMENNISSNSYGIYLLGAEWNIIEENEILYNQFYGLAMWETDNETIAGNTFYWNYYFAIYLENVTESTITDNNITWNGWLWIGEGGPPAPPSGIVMLNCTNVIVSYNQMWYNYYGIYMNNCSYSTVEYNNIIGSLWEWGETGIMMGNYYGGYYRCYNVIQHNNISNYSFGIYITSTDNETIRGNVIFNNTVDGIYLEDTENISIEENWIHNNSEGIYIYNAPFTYIINNTIENNIGGETGIYIDGNSNHSTIIGNTIRYNDVGIYIWGGFEWSYENTDTEIHWNKIYDNSMYGLLYEIETGGTPYINATYNFWGNGNGPSNDSMIDPVTGEWADGTGDAIGGGIVNDNIHFDPWIGKVKLYEGWNTICLPVWNESITTAEELGDYINMAAGDNVCVIISKWDASKQRYISHVVGFGGDGFTLKPGEGYFIYVEEEMNISFDGTIIEPEVNLTLYSGYNFIGWTKTIPTHIKNIGENLSQCTKAVWWHADRQEWDPGYSYVKKIGENKQIIVGETVFLLKKTAEIWQG